MKQKIIYTLLLVGSGILVYANLYHLRQPTENGDIENYEDYYIRYDVIKRGLFLQLENEGKKVTSYNYLFDSHGDSIPLRDLDSKLIFYTGVDFCSSCVTGEIKKIKQFSAIYGKENVVILFHYQDKNSLKVFIREHELDIPVYSLNKKTVGLDLENEYLPFYFLLNREMCAEKVFIPFKDFDDYTEEYFRILIQERKEI